MTAAVRAEPETGRVLPMGRLLRYSPSWFVRALQKSRQPDTFARMGFRFRRSFPVIPGVRMNLSKSGASVSVGRRGAWITVGPKGTRRTIGLPGTGLSYTESSPVHSAHQVTSKFGTSPHEDFGSPQLGRYGIPLPSRSIWPTPFRSSFGASCWGSPLRSLCIPDSSRRR